MQVVLCVVAFVACAVSAMEETDGQEECICTADFRPVCSTEGEMFPNLCNLMCNKDKTFDMRKYYNRQSERCEKACFCPLIWSPVCTSDNVMYASACALECNGDKTVDNTKKYDQEKRECVPVSSEETPAEATDAPAEAVPVEETPAEEGPA